MEIKKIVSEAAGITFVFTLTGIVAVQASMPPGHDERHPLHTPATAYQNVVVSSTSAVGVSGGDFRALYAQTVETLQDDLLAKLHAAGMSLATWPMP